MEIHNLGTKPFGDLLQLVLQLTTSIFSVTAVSLGPSKAGTTHVDSACRNTTHGAVLVVGMYKSVGLVLLY